MAFQVGDIKISGTIDDLSFYNSVFGWLVRQKGGPTRKQFKRSPSYARARENSSEFTLCSQAASSIRQLVIKHTGIKDKTLYHRLMKLMRLLADADQTSVRGKRDPLKGIHTAQGKQLLKDFRIDPVLDLYTVLISIELIQPANTITDPGSYRDAEDKTPSCRKQRRRKRFLGMPKEQPQIVSDTLSQRMMLSLIQHRRKYRDLIWKDDNSAKKLLRSAQLN